MLIQYKTVVTTHTGVINYDPKFGGYLYDLMATGKEKGKAFEKVVKDNEEEITEKMEGILIEMLK